MDPSVQCIHRHDGKMPVAESLASGKTHTVYGPVKQGDTLGGIAKDIVLPSGASFNQMLVALHRANPDAFIDGNMHQLKAGPVLKIPDSNEIAAISPAEANQEVQVQTVGLESAEISGGRGGGRTKTNRYRGNRSKR